ncbi:MAG: hypothetical protein JWP44_5106 [Mucilaginibacter sp.]|nr:hypothetical protein [Mucilaginibacter sp.]
MTTHAVDAAGHYLGAFGGGTVTERLMNGSVIIRDVSPLLPEGAVIVSHPPADIRQVWNGSSWAFG